MEIAGLHAYILIQKNRLIDAAIAQPNVLEQVCGQPALIYTTKTLTSLNIPTTLLVDDAQAAPIQSVINQYHDHKVTVVSRPTDASCDKQLVQELTTCPSERLLILEGALPLLSDALITRLYTQHTQTNAAISLVTAHVEDTPLSGYAPIACSQNAQQQCCVNAGMLLVERAFLQDAQQQCSACQLTKKAYAEQKRVTTVAARLEELGRMNTFQELWAVEQIKRSAIITHWMRKGVRFSAPQTVHIDGAVTIGTGSRIGTGVHLFGATTIGNACTIHEFSSLDTAKLGDNSTVYSHSVVKKSSIGNHAQIGPFAHINGDNTIGEGVMLGNFIEIKRSTIGAKTKIKHHAYLGDAHLGNQVNIGAGTITCNHDGFSKHTTTIGNNAYIGTNTTLIAPLIIEHDAFIAAGSAITKDVPNYALAIARTRQTNKLGYVHVLREKKQKTNNETTTVPTDAQENEATSFIGAVKPSSETPSDRL